MKRETDRIPERIAMIRLSSMGDVIHALPAGATLKHNFPDSRLTWLIRPKWMPLLEGNPYVDEVVPVERSIVKSLSVARRLRAGHFELVIDFQGLIQTALLAAAIRAEKLAGFDRPRERAAAWLYSSHVAVRAEHAVDRNLELVSGLGATKLLPVFPLPQGQPEGTLPEGNFVLACPLAGWGSKQWPLAYWSELASILNLPLVVNGPPASAPQLEQIRGAHVHLSGIAGLIDATRRAHSVIGVDSGPMHLAAALAKPGVALFGPTDPARHGPYGGSLQVLRSARAITNYHRDQEPAESMRALTPPMVTEALASALEKSHAPEKGIPKNNDRSFSR